MSHDAVTTAAALSCIYFLYFQLADENRNIEGIEVHGASAFKVSRHVHLSCSCHVSRVQIMRVLCSKAGWSTSGEPVATTVCEGKPSFMWTLTRKCE